MAHRDDFFRPKLGRQKSTGATSPRFITRVIKAASQAGHVARGQVSPARARPGAKLGRGFVAARLARQRASATSRRVTIKMRMVILAKAGPRSTPTHLRYLEREGTTPEGERGQAYGPIHDDVDAQDFERRGCSDRHQFRFIVSAEDGTELKDLKGFTRDLMSQMERDLGARLEWIAVDHWDTEHPHTHIVLRGKDPKGKDLIIAREYISYGMRARASEIATEWLGPRTQQDIDASTRREVAQDRWTGLDATIHQAAADGVLDTQALARSTRFAPQRAAMIGRLQYLSTMDLAESIQPGVWRVSPKAADVLRAMGERGDIVRTLQRAMAQNLRDYQVFDAARAASVTGRIVDKGLHDELSDRGYLVVDGLDGRAHYAVLATPVDLATLPMGAIVTIRGADPRSADREIQARSAEGIYRSANHLHELRADANPPRDPEAVVQAHVRRLEALRRAQIVDRISEGVWQVPSDLSGRGRDYDLKRLGGAEVELRCPLPIERQTTAMGATWLDQQLIKGPTGLPSTEFGSDIGKALLAREQFLVDQGLARRSGQRVLLAQNLLSTLRSREIDDIASRIAETTGHEHRPLQEGLRVSGVYRESIQLTSGRFALLDDGVGFSLVPWHPVIDKRLGQSLSAVVDGSRVNWELGRSRSRSV